MNDNRPLVSIIVPVFNVAPYLTDCLDSLISQTYTSIQIILIDDESTDGSSKICLSYSLKDSRVIVIRQAHSGPGPAKNRGIDYAKGDFVMFVDADDYVAEDTISLCLDAFFRDKSDVVVFGYSNVDVKGRLLNGSSRGGLYNRSRFLELVYSFIPLEVVWAKLIRRSVLGDYRFRKGIFEDGDFAVGLARNGNRFSFVDKTLYFHRKRHGSIMDSFRAPENSIYSLEGSANNLIWSLNMREYEFAAKIEWPRFISFLKETLLANVSLLRIRDCLSAVRRQVLEHQADLIQTDARLVKKMRLVVLPPLILKLWCWKTILLLN